MKKLDHYNFFLHYMKMSETILNRAKEYYKNNTEVLKEKARNKYRENIEEIDIKICLKKIKKD